MSRRHPLVTPILTPCPLETLPFLPPSVHSTSTEVNRYTFSRSKKDLFIPRSFLRPRDRRRWSEDWARLFEVFRSLDPSGAVFPLPFEGLPEDIPPLRFARPVSAFKFVLKQFPELSKLFFLKRLLVVVPEASEPDIASQTTTSTPKTSWRTPE